MVHELPAWGIAVLNAAGLPILQIGLAWLFTRMPEDWFACRADARPRVGWRSVAKWKHRVPDGAAWFRGGFGKKRLASSDPDYLRRFIAETRRGEACHWCAIAGCGLFLPFNPWWGDAIIVVYAVAANLPCIAIQRFNRGRILRVLERQRRAEARSARS